MFFSNEEKETLAVFTDCSMVPETESSLLVLSALMDIVNFKIPKKQTARLLLDCVSQKSYISEDLVNKLQLTPSNTEIPTVFTFGSGKQKQLQRWIWFKFKG